jgi:hypothetical protein
MSTAILISGQLRTFAKCWPTQRWHVLRHFADPHFFITVQFDQAEIIADLIKEYGRDRVHYDPRTDPDLSAHLTPELSAAYHQAPYTNAAPAHQLLLQHWYQNEVWKFFQSPIAKTPKSETTELRASASSSFRDPSFDTIIRLRGDLWFHSLDPGPWNVGIGHEEAFTPWWGRFGGINDRFAVLGLRAARYYFTVFENIAELIHSGCPFHPESLVKANLERGSIDLHETLRTEFTTLRTNGQHRPPEIMPWDIAHAALRAS